MTKPKPTADTSLLWLIKSGTVLKMRDSDDSPIVRRSSAANRIVAERGPRILRHGYPTFLNEKRFPMTKQGLTDAMNWAGKSAGMSVHFEIEEREGA